MPEDGSPRNSPIVFLTIVLSTTCVVLILLGWTMWNSYEVSKISKERYSKIEELRGIIIHLDEVLTMSARMAAATGDLRWEKRYHSFEPKLDAAIKEAMGIVPEAYGSEAAAQTDAANINLVTMENQAFDLVRQGRVDEASSILFGDAYERQKVIYSQGMTKFSDSLSIIISAGMKRDLHHALLYISTAILLIPLLLISLFLLFRAVSKWHVSLTSSNRILSEQSKELVALNKSLDGKVDERTAELTEANKMLHESEERSRAITQTAKDAIITINHSNNIVFWNEAASNMFGYAKTEVVGKPISQLIPQRYKMAHKKGVERAITTDVHSVIGKTVGLAGLKKDDSEFPLEISLSKWGTTEGVFYTGILRDISERKQAEEQRDKLIEKLQKTLTEVKTLRGFLPICSHCKKIRDDKGYWNQIESYIHKHSDAEFSHGICPECAKKHYPELNIYDDNESWRLKNRK